MRDRKDRDKRAVLAFLRACSLMGLVLTAGCDHAEIDISQAGVPAEGELEKVSYDELGDQRVADLTARLLGEPAPSVDFPMLDGNSIALAELVGEKPLYLKFWATWCIPCRQQMPHFEEIFERHGRELNVLAVNVGLNDTPASARSFQQEYGLTMPMAFDELGDVARAFQLVVTPQHVLIDREGVVQYLGHSAGTLFEEALQAVLASGPFPDRATESLPRGDTRLEEEDGPEIDRLSLALIDGSSFEVEAQRGRPVVLSFTATWCDWYLAETRPEMSKACIEQQQNVEQARRHFSDKVAWVVIAQSLWTDRTQVEDYRERHEIETPLGLDETKAWFLKYRVRDVPTTLILNEQGTEVERLVGPAEGLAERVAALTVEGEGKSTGR